MTDEEADGTIFSECRVCDGVIGWVECPTGGWWAHERHPADNHDAAPLSEPSLSGDGQPTTNVGLEKPI